MTMDNRINKKRIIFKNINTLLKFELIYKILTIFIFIPFLLNIFNLSLTISNISYLTFDNLFSYISTPLSLIILLFVIIFLSILIIFEFTSINVIFSFSYSDKKVKLKDSLLISFNKFINSFNIKNIIFIFLSLSLIPFLNFGFSPSKITSINVIDYLLEYVSNSYSVLINYFVITLLMLVIFSRFLFSINFIISDNCSLKESFKRSNYLFKKMNFFSKIMFIVFNVLYYLSYIIMIILGFSLVLFLGNIIFYGDISVINYYLFFLFFLLILVVNVLCFMFFSWKFFENKLMVDKKVLPIRVHKLLLSMRNTNIIKCGNLAVVFLFFLSLSLFTYHVLSGKIFYKDYSVRVLGVTAHRGASKDFPENTMASFLGAKRIGADWIEIDVRQTKDKKIVLSHDPNLKRVTGVFKEIEYSSYDDIYLLDAAFYRGKNHKEEKIPLLEDAIKFAKDNNVKLNIEVKPVGYEVDFEKQIIDLIYKYDCKDLCAVASQNYDVLKNVKMIDPSIKTIFVMMYYDGNILDFVYADIYSIDYNYLTEDIVKNIHNGGKEVYAWTVNNEDKINEMLDIGVDNIITDDVNLGKKLIDRRKYGELFTDFINVFK